MALAAKAHCRKTSLVMTRDNGDACHGYVAGKCREDRQKQMRCRCHAVAV